MTGDLVVRWPVQRVLQVMAAGLTPKNQFSCEMSYGNVAATGSPRYIFCFFFLFPPLLDSRSHVASRENCVVPRLLLLSLQTSRVQSGPIGKQTVEHRYRCRSLVFVRRRLRQFVYARQEARGATERAHVLADSRHASRKER